MEKTLDNFFDSVIIRFSGEIWLKKVWTRKYYEKRLARNIKQTLKYHKVSFNKLVRKFSRFYLKTDYTFKAVDVLTRVFGISSLSPAYETSSSFDDLIDECLNLAGILLHKGNTFAVRCKRVGSHNYSSDDVRKEIGKYILDNYGKKLGINVDLSNPDVVIGVEIRDNQAFIYSEIKGGAGGMPLGVQPALISLFSGGIDSAVSSWLVMKRGCRIIPVYFNNDPYTDETVTERAFNVAKTLFNWSIGFPRRIYVVNHGKNLEQIIQTNRKYSCLLCKRMMYRVAERLANIYHAEGIVTGEAIGEQASQTLTNLRVLSAAAKDFPVHRPLLGFDKHETEAIGRKIGTYEPSSVKAASCGAVPYQPSTKAKLDDVIKAEEKLPIELMIEESIKSIKIFEL